MYSDGWDGRPVKRVYSDGWYATLCRDGRPVKRFFVPSAPRKFRKRRALRRVWSVVKVRRLDSDYDEYAVILTKQIRSIVDGDGVPFFHRDGDVVRTRLTFREAIESADSLEVLSSVMGT